MIRPSAPAAERRDHMPTPTVDRRSLLKWMALGAAAPSVAACARTFRPLSADVASRRLARVRVAPERVIRQVVGLRPFRRSGFRVAAASSGDTTLFHNAGRGGGGFSFSWGGGDPAATLPLETPRRDAAVIGCGAL